MKDFKNKNEEANKSLLAMKDVRINELISECSAIKVELDVIKETMDDLNRQNTLFSEKNNQLLVDYQQSKADSDVNIWLQT
jgi:hypothetical protein